VRHTLALWWSFIFTFFFVICENGITVLELAVIAIGIIAQSKTAVMQIHSSAW
jgi:hypothetical protein